MKKVNSLLPLFFFTILFLLFPSKSSAEVENFEKDLAIDSSKPVYLEFRDVDGTLSFTSWKENVVRIRVEKRIKLKERRRAKQLLRETKVHLYQKGNTIRVEIKYPKMKGLFFWLKDYQRVNVATEIMLPPNSNLNCRVEDGSINGKNAKGEMIMKTEDGSIHLSDMEGSVQAITEDGKIILKNIEGETVAKSEDGDITLSGRFKKLSLKTEDGNITLELASPSILATDWKIETEDGDVNFFLPSDFSANFLFQTQDGDISCQIPITLSNIVSGRELSGKINQGGKLLLISTEDGDITVKSLPSEDKHDSR